MKSWTSINNKLPKFQIKGNLFFTPFRLTFNGNLLNVYLTRLCL
jgi:hypothetical protein